MIAIGKSRANKRLANIFVGFVPPCRRARPGIDVRLAIGSPESGAGVGRSARQAGADDSPVAAGPYLIERPLPGRYSAFRRGASEVRVSIEPGSLKASGGAANVGVKWCVSSCSRFLSRLFSDPRLKKNRTSKPKEIMQSATGMASIFPLRTRYRSPMPSETGRINAAAANRSTRFFIEGAFQSQG